MDTIYDMLEKIRVQAQREKICAIRDYRILFGGSLADAKEEVEALMTIKAPIKYGMAMVGRFSGLSYTLGAPNVKIRFFIRGDSGNEGTISITEFADYKTAVASFSPSYDRDGYPQWPVSVDGQVIATFTDEAERDAFITWKNS